MTSTEITTYMLDNGWKPFIGVGCMGELTLGWRLSNITGNQFMLIMWGNETLDDFYRRCLLVAEQWLNEHGIQCEELP
jgi:hypothetical protein